MFKFLVDVKQELYNISWSSKREVMGFLIIAMIVVALSSMFFCFVDFIFIKVVRVILGIIYGA